MNHQRLFPEQHILTSGQPVLWQEKKGVSFSGQIPERLELFKDHFPDFPVLPGVLSIEIFKRAAEYYLRQTQKRSNSCSLKEVRAVKFSRFLKPGDRWDCEVELTAQDLDRTEWKGTLKCAGERAASAIFCLSDNASF